MKNLKYIICLISCVILTACMCLKANADTMNDKKECIASICAASASGNMKELRLAYIHGLENGISRGDLADIMYLVGIFAGYPLAEASFDVISSVNEERSVRGMTVTELPTEIAPVALDAKCQSSFLRTVKNTQLSQLSPSLGVEAFGAISGALCGRGEMSFEYRAIAVIATLAVTDLKGGLIKYQMKRELTFGVTENDLRTLISCISRIIGPERTKSASAIIDECVAEHQRELKEAVYIFEVNDGKPQ